MKKINLRADKFKPQRKSGGSGAILFGGILLFISLAFYGWFYFQNESTIKKVDSTKDKIAKTKKEIQALQFEGVYNFEKRLISLDGQMDNFIDKNSSFNKIASATYPEAYFDKIKITSGEMFDSYETTIVVPDLLFLAKQVKAYETLKDVANIDFGEVSFTENGVTTDLKFDTLYQPPQTTGAQSGQTAPIQTNPEANL